MTLIWLCRLLCLMYCILSFFAMATTVTPEHETFANVCRVVVIVMAILSGVAATGLHRLYLKRPDHPLLRSKIAIAVGMILSILGMMLLGG